jgi:hypothetical protein
MNRILLLWIFSAVILHSCRKEDPDPGLGSGAPRQVHIGEYRLLDNSKTFIPYTFNSSPTFVDGLGDTITLQLQLLKEYSIESGIRQDNVNGPGDRVIFLFKKYEDRVYMENQAKGINIEVKLSPEFYYPDLESGFVEDLLTVTFKDPNVPNLYHTSFRHVVARRTYPIIDTSANTILHNSITLVEREFQQVLQSDVPTSAYRVYYQKDLGLVGFYDHTGNLWRLKE